MGEPLVSNRPRSYTKYVRMELRIALAKGGPPQQGGSRSDKKHLPHLTRYICEYGLGEVSCAFGAHPAGVGHPLKRKDAVMRRHRNAWKAGRILINFACRVAGFIS